MPLHDTLPVLGLTLQALAVVSNSCRSFLSTLAGRASAEAALREVARRWARLLEEKPLGFEYREPWKQEAG